MMRCRPGTVPVCGGPGSWAISSIRLDILLAKVKPTTASFTGSFGMGVADLF